MDFSTLFRTKENLNLDKSTLTILRYIAILGQFAAINIVFFYLDLNFPIKETYIVIFIGLLTNLFLQFKIKVIQLKDTYASLFHLQIEFQNNSKKLNLSKLRLVFLVYKSWEHRKYLTLVQVKEGKF